MLHIQKLLYSKDTFQNGVYVKRNKLFYSAGYIM